jgi:hypothetical protein
VSRGPGSAQRFILEEVDGWEFIDGQYGMPRQQAPLEPGTGLPLLVLAERYAKAEDLPFTRNVIESVRRAARNLERKGLVSLSYWWLPHAGAHDKIAGRRERRMLLVGPPGNDRLVPWWRVLPNKTSPERELPIEWRIRKHPHG